MDEQRAEQLAAAVGGEAWQSGGGMWLVVLERPDGALVVFSGDAVCEYPDWEAFDQSDAAAMITLPVVVGSR
jgi:hypothetical protein